MRILIGILSLFAGLNSSAQLLDDGGYYRTGQFFEEYERLKKVAIDIKKPIVLLAGFKGCVGCEDLKQKMKKNRSAYDKAAVYMPISVASDSSRFFYTTLGIKKIGSAPQSFLINPLTNKAKKVDAFEVKEIEKLARAISWESSAKIKK